MKEMVSAVFPEAGGSRSAETIRQHPEQCLCDCFFKRVSRSGSSPPQERLDLREHLLNGREIRGMGKQEE
jgi:hypothetical protein